MILDSERQRSVHSVRTHSRRRGRSSRDHEGHSVGTHDRVEKTRRRGPGHRGRGFPASIGRPHVSPVILQGGSGGHSPVPVCPLDESRNRCRDPCVPSIDEFG